MPDKPLLSDAILGAARQRTTRGFAAYMVLVHKTDMVERAEGWAKPFPHHYQMIDALLDASLGNLAIVAPRDSAKTSIAQYYVEWEIGLASLSADPDWAERIRILYLRHAEDKALEVSLSVMRTIEGNAMYQAIFPKVRPDEKKWSQSAWSVKGNTGKDSTFTTGGIDSPPLGGRFDIGLFDDVSYMKNVATEGERQKFRTTMNRVVMPMCAPGGRGILLATRWHFEDAVAWAEEHGWHMLTMKALTQDEDGEYHSYCPERYPVERLLAMREADPRDFSLQYQNEVTPEEGLTFERWWFQRRFDLLPSDVAFRFESWDLAATQGKKSDWSVGIAMIATLSCPLCQGAPWHILVPHMFRGKLAYGYLKMSMRDVYQMMGGYSTDHYIVVEKKSVGEALAGEGLGERADAYPIRFRSASGEGQSAGAKLKNIADAAEVCRQGRVHLPSDDFLARRTGSRQWLSEFERLLFSYAPEDTHTNDVVTAFVQGILEVEERRIRWQKMVQQPREAVPFYTRPGVRKLV